MPTFDELLESEFDPAGVVWLLDITFNDFATVAHRWSTASVRIDGNEYDGRIASMSPIERGFGRDRLPAATTTKLRIENSDFAADWLINRETVGSQLLQARFRLSVYLYDSRAYSAADALSGATQVIGVFTCLDEPEAMANAVDLTLADDSLGRLAEPLTTPTVRDWATAAIPGFSDPSSNPLREGSPVPLMDWDVPLPIVFGLGAEQPLVPAYAAVAQYMDNEGVPYNSKQLAAGLVPPRFPIVVCAAKANNQPSGHEELLELQVTFGNDVTNNTEMRGVTLSIPRVFQQRFEVTGGYAYGQSFEIWRPRRSSVITKSGREWQVVWLEFVVEHYITWWHQALGPSLALTTTGGNVTQEFPVPLAGPNSPAVVAAGGLAWGSRGHYMGAFSAFHVRAGILGSLSMVTTRFYEPLAREAPSRRLVDMIHDAIAYYSKASASDIDTAAFERASKARATVLGAGIIQPARPRPLASIQRNGWISPNPRDGIVGVLRTALGEMCGSADVDLFMTKEGLYSVSTIVFDFEAVTGTRTAIDEARTSRFRTRTPSKGERWAPYNRVFLQGPGGTPFGPFDNQEAIDDWGVIRDVTLQAKWNAQLWGENSAAGASTVWAYRTLESKVRPAIRLNADRAYLALELGDYFEATWSRGGASSLYSGTIFRLETMRIDPVTLAVELGAIWADDLNTINPYLLDDEEFLVRVASSAGRTAAVTDTSANVTFSSGDLDADGVVAGDILVLKDATQAANVFTRHRALRITGIAGALDLEVAAPADDPDLDFDAPSGAAVATWEIRRGALTYHDSSSDPVNYPSGGAMYGKASDENNQFSDGSDANQLLEG